MEHEAYKTKIRTFVASAKPPDLFSYWCGDKGRSFVDAKLLQPITDLWEERGYDNVFPDTVKRNDTYYGEKYGISMGIHMHGIIYNKKMFDELGVTKPATWNALVTTCEKIKQSGISPILIGYKSRYPVLYWMDYLLSQTVGPEFFERLGQGQESWQDPKVYKTFELHKTLLDKDFFMSGGASWEWRESLPYYVQKKAAMTLLGQWSMPAFNVELGLFQVLIMIGLATLKLIRI